MRQLEQAEAQISDWTAQHWDERYAAAELVWGAGPNRWVVAELAELPPGEAIDVACGEGRNAIWLARRGWRVTAADFSRVALERGRAMAGELAIEWLCVDVTDWQPPSADLILICYLQLPGPALHTVLRAAAGALRPGGTLLVIGHDRRNLTEGTGGPQDPSVLYTPHDVIQALADLQIEKAETVERPVPGAPRPALDVLVRAVRV